MEWGALVNIHYTILLLLYIYYLSTNGYNVNLIMRIEMEFMSDFDLHGQQMKTSEVHGRSVAQAKFTRIRAINIKLITQSE